ncbi:MAG: 50S ribosomal protein L5 [Anaerolineales bacterium]|jgi:large subunit ribosomal protein L5|nr:50S ribosomal protein L5 [Anaerolineales bacterium]
MPDLKNFYLDEVAPELMKEFGLRNVMQAPRVSKVVLNIGLGGALDNAKVLDAAIADLSKVAGQQPVITRARKSVANFKLREGQAVGTKVTLRGGRMWEFLDRLMHITLPRVRDFRGLPPTGFDGRGNFTLGLRDQLAFPEIDYDSIDRLRGMEITLVTTALDDEHGLRLLTLLGMPFRQKVN